MSVKACQPGCLQIDSVGCLPGGGMQVACADNDLLALSSAP
jgi:hypothetical protein